MSTKHNNIGNLRKDLKVRVCQRAAADKFQVLGVLRLPAVMFHHFHPPDRGQRSQSPELASRVAVWQVLTLGREIEELFPDVRVDFYVFARHDIADRRHTCPNELMLVEGNLADLIQDLL